MSCVKEQGPTQEQQQQLCDDIGCPGNGPVFFFSFLVLSILAFFVLYSELVHNNTQKNDFPLESELSISLHFGTRTAMASFLVSFNYFLKFRTLCLVSIHRLVFSVAPEIHAENPFFVQRKTKGLSKS